MTGSGVGCRAVLGGRPVGFGSCLRPVRRACFIRGVSIVRSRPRVIRSRAAGIVGSWMAVRDGTGLVHIDRSGASRRYGMLPELSRRGYRPRGCCIRGMAMILGDEVGAILTGECSLLLLSVYRSVAPVAGSGFLGCRGANHHAAASTVIADSVDVHVADVSVVDVSVADDGAVHLYDRGIVTKIVTIPAAAIKSRSCIAVSVVDAAIVADLGTPVAGVPGIATVIPAPVAGSP